MRGSIHRGSKCSWRIALDLGYETNPQTGIRRRKQRWLVVQGPKREAERKLAELVHTVSRGEFVEPSKRTVGEWLLEWMEKVIRPTKRIRTYETYHSIIVRYLIPRLGFIPLQQLKAVDLERYYSDVKACRIRPLATAKGGLSEISVSVHHVILHSALNAALLDSLVTRNVAKLVKGKPRRRESHEAVQHHCWDAAEARAFMQTAKVAGPQPAAFYALALDTGVRKAELCGLAWSEVDFKAGTVTISRQLVKRGPPPVFGPVKAGKPRVIDVSAETLVLLRKHHARQAEVKLANRLDYHDHGLVFAKEGGSRQRTVDTLGDPLQMNNLGQREFATLTKRAEVRRIKFHGMRHTCATLMLQAGISSRVVQERLGHQKIEITMNVYAHVLPAMQQDAAAKLGAILHG